MKANLMKFKCKNRLAIIFAFLIGVLAFETTIMQVVYLIGKFIFAGNEENGIDTVYNVEKKIVWPIIDFFMAAGVLLIFYSIGMKRRKSDLAGQMTDCFDQLHMNNISSGSSFRKI